MDQINEAYEFIKDVFRDNASDVLRKVYVNPAATATTAATATAVAVSTKTSKKKSATGWILHPCPRNVVKLKH
jgi:hypothetical protein